MLTGRQENEVKERREKEYKPVHPLRHPNMGHPDAQQRVPMSLVKVVEQHTQLTKQTVGLGATIVSHGGTTGVQDFPICSPQRTTACVTTAFKFTCNSHLHLLPSSTCLRISLYLLVSIAFHQVS